MIDWFKNLFKTKYEVRFYENYREGRKQKVLLKMGNSAVTHAERQIDMLDCEYLESIGYKLVKIETRYL